MLLDRLEWFFIGFSGLFEIVLLLLLVQPINRSHVALWLKWLLSGAFIYHASYFMRLLLQNERTSSAAWLDRVAMCGLCFGLSLMPSAMLHAALRLRNFRQSSSVLSVKPNRWYGFIYTPLLFAIAAGWFIVFGPDGDFMTSVAPLTWIYLGWLSIANLVSASIFLKVGMRLQDRSTRQFFLLTSGLLLLLTLGAVFYAGWSVGTGAERIARMFMGVAPLFPGLVFVWFTLKSRLLPVVFEQSIVYGGIVLVCLFVHRLIVTPMTIDLRSRFDIDFIIIEVLLVTMLIWFVRPLRRRVSESLRFLFSPSVFRVRDEARSLAIEIAQQVSPTIDERCNWFANELSKRFELQWVNVLYLASDTSQSKLIQHATSRTVGDFGSWSSNAIVDLLRECDRPIERGEASDASLAAFMESVGCDVAFPMRYKTIHGIVLFGSRKRFDRLADEQIMAISVLIDQFAATLQNSRDGNLRRLAERQNLQQEKLSTLGLISGSLAHELRNPLSSIRTIASLVAEDLSGDDSNRKDLGLIVSEVDRLNRTLQQMLDFARPPDPQSCLTEPDRVIARLLAIMDHYAKDRSIQIDLALNCTGVKIEASDSSLNEILMNLIKNAIEAAAESVNVAGKVSIKSERVESLYRVTVSDNGIGIEESRLATIFLPFETSKTTGTGLGLYIVAERVKELGGHIHVQSKPSEGSAFIVELTIRE